MNPEQQSALQGAWAGLREGDLPRAWRLCQTLVKQFPDDAAGLDVASRVALAMGQRRLAEQLADRAVSLAPREFSFLTQRAFSLLALKKTAEADEFIEQLAAFPLDQAADQDTLGNLFSSLGDQSRALQHFKRAVAIDPDSAHFWLNLALSLQATGELEQAETAFDRCIVLIQMKAQPGCTVRGCAHRARSVTTWWHCRRHWQGMREIGAGK